MIHIVDKHQCCGCTSCQVACPQDAIEMRPDALGFQYPVVNNDRCINCGLCEKACAFNPFYDQESHFSEPNVFAARLRDEQELIKSRSGGLFYALARHYIEIGGIVYGAAFNGVSEVVHKRITTIEDLQQLRGCKYVQSNLDRVFDFIIDDLKKGRSVLFSGTGCQVAGLHSLLKTKNINDSRLILCDIICHGVPSPYAWREHIKYIEKKYHGTVETVNFRDKSLGWKASVSSFKLAGGQIIHSSLFNEAFINHYLNRLSCGTCYFANLKRPGDITLGDFWGIEKVKPEWFTDDKGASLVLINTHKGKMAFDSVTNELNIVESNTEECIQLNLQKPSAVSTYRENFETAFAKRGYVYAMREYGDLSFKRLFNKKFIALKSKVKQLIR